MKPNTKRKADRMTAAECRKLVLLIPPLLTFYGFKQIHDEPAYVGGVWGRDCPRFDEQSPCMFEVRPIIEEDEGHPWLACSFNRAYRDTSKPWDHAANAQTYRDIDHALGSVNLYSGKYNQHIFTRCTADECLQHFEQHLRSVFPGGPWFDTASVSAAKAITKASQILATL